MNTTLEERMQAILASEPVAATAEESAAIRAAEREGYENAVPMDAFLQDLEGYSGKLLLRLPRSLHKRLKLEANAEGVSLNQYMLYKLSL